MKTTVTRLGSVQARYEDESKGNGQIVSVISTCVQIVSKYTLDKPPKLVEIIAAVPEEHRVTLLPQ